VPLLLAQNTANLRIILIGDAGEINAAQKNILKDAINKKIPGRLPFRG